MLVTPRNPLNIGAAARAMSNFGFRKLRLVNPYEPAFHEARSAVRARYILDEAQVHSSLAEAVADCDLVIGTTALGNRDLHIPLHRLESAGTSIRERLAGSSVALLFGSEKFGLSNEDLSFCHWALRIPTREEHGSMNLGQAVAICLYELSRSEEAAATPQFTATAASADEVERFTSLLLTVLNTVRIRRSHNLFLNRTENPQAGTALISAVGRHGDVAWHHAPDPVEGQKDRRKLMLF